jgi:hypothetical protein
MRAVTAYRLQLSTTSDTIDHQPRGLRKEVNENCVKLSIKNGVLDIMYVIYVLRGFLIKFFSERMNGMSASAAGHCLS